MSIRVMSLVWDHYPGKNGELLLALKLADTANDAGESIFKKVETIARQTRMSVRAVQSLLRQMEESGFLVVTKHAQGGRGHAREYCVNPRWLANPLAPLDGALKSAEIEPLKPTVKGAESAPFMSLKGADFDNKGCTQLHPLASHHIYVNRPYPSPLPPDGGDVGFEQWWQAYPKPRRIAKSKCLRIWRRKGLEDRVDDVMRVLVADIASTQWNRDEFQYVPLPATWLSQDRFDRDVGVVLPVKRACVECGADAGFKVGGRDLCAVHFRERE